MSHFIGFAKRFDSLLKPFFQFQNVLLESYNNTLVVSANITPDQDDCDESSGYSGDDELDSDEAPSDTNDTEDHNETAHNYGSGDNEDPDHLTASVERAKPEPSDDFDYADYCQEEEARRTSRIWRRNRDLIRARIVPPRPTANTRRRRNRQLRRAVNRASSQPLEQNSGQESSDSDDEGSSDDNDGPGSWRPVQLNFVRACGRTGIRTGTTQIDNEGSSSVIHANRFGCLRSERL